MRWRNFITPLGSVAGGACTAARTDAPDRRVDAVSCERSKWASPQRCVPGGVARVASLASKIFCYAEIIRVPLRRDFD
jgi:hypothetical protein